jgi:hypothetical protein
MMKLDKDFASKPPITQLLVLISTIHHAQHGLLLKCSFTPKHQDAPGGINEGEGPLASKCKAMEEGIKPVLDLIGMDLEEGPTDQPVRQEAIIEKCQSSWSCFKQFICDAGEYVAAHVLAMV